MHYVAVDGVIEVDEFVGDGTTTNFATSLSIINEDATQVYVSGVYQSKLTYQTTGNVVSFTTAPPNGANIEIVHIKALALSGFNKNNFVGTGSQTAFTLNTTVNEENMTFVFLEGIYQDKSTYGISGSTLTFATAPQSGYNVEVMVLGAISASTNALYTDTFTGDGTETDYTLGITPVDLNAIEVYLNGLYQNVGTLSLAANVVTFATPPPSGVIIEIRSVGFLNSGGTLAPATLTGSNGIEVITNSPNNFTISRQPTVSFLTPTGQNLTYSAVIPTSSTGVAGSTVPTTTFTVTDPLGGTLSGAAVITGLPSGFTSSQSYNNTNPGNILTITLGGVYPSVDSLNINLTISGLTVTLLPIPVDYLVVAGGGAGGGYIAGGGGAGGLRTSYGTSSGGGSASESTLNLIASTNYIVTVGAGSSAPGNGITGSNSVFSNITSLGGGGGGGPGTVGGSGGGGSYTQSGAAGTANQGYAGGNGQVGGSSFGGGGGGAGGVGSSSGSGGSGTDGGAGLSISITGTAVTYATGGRGGGNTNPGGRPNEPSNTGNGGDGSYQGNGAGNGGSGIVVLRYPNTKTITIPATLAATTVSVGSDEVATFTAGTGNIQFN
jgi:hypothetical protein